MSMLTTAQAAEKLGISSRRVLALIQAERLPAEPFGPTYMIREKDLALARIIHEGAEVAKGPARSGAGE
jgi:excisionase family DNA binding protein